MTTSNRLAITELASTQTDRAATVNDAIAKLEAGATCFSAIQVSLNTPPGAPAEGDLYVVGTAPTGAWAANAKQVAVYNNAAWFFLPLFEGQLAYDRSNNTLYFYDATAWSVFIAAGGITLASTTEQLTGTSSSKASTPDSVAALWEAGADITDGATITIGEGGYFNLITSTTAITAFTITTDKAGRTFRVRFNTIRTLTHNAASLILPGAANITTAAGDIAQFRSLGGGNVVCEWYTRASGLPLGYDADTLKSDTAANLTAGFTATAYNAGTQSSGTYTPDPDNGNFQRAVNGGAHTLAPPSATPGDSLSMIIQYTNNASAGTITTSGFTKVSGDSLTTTNGDDFMFYITVCNGFSHLAVTALQ